MMNVHYLNIDNFKKGKLSKLPCIVSYQVNHYVPDFKISLGQRCGNELFHGSLLSQKESSDQVHIYGSSVIVLLSCIQVSHGAIGIWPLSLKNWDLSLSGAAAANWWPVDPWWPVRSKRLYLQNKALLASANK